MAIGSAVGATVGASFSVGAGVGSAGFSVGTSLGATAGSGVVGAPQAAKPTNETKIQKERNEAFMICGLLNNKSKLDINFDCLIKANLSGCLRE
jgi:hypothetical protein